MKSRQFQEVGSWLPAQIQKVQGDRASLTAAIQALSPLWVNASAIPHEKLECGEMSILAITRSAI